MVNKTKKYIYLKSHLKYDIFLHKQKNVDWKKIMFDFENIYASLGLW
jgi:hypothetical protein